MLRSERSADSEPVTPRFGPRVQAQKKRPRMRSLAGGEEHGSGKVVDHHRANGSDDGRLPSAGGAIRCSGPSHVRAKVPSPTARPNNPKEHGSAQRVIDLRRRQTADGDGQRAHGEGRTLLRESDLLCRRRDSSRDSRTSATAGGDGDDPLPFAWARRDSNSQATRALAPKASVSADFTTRPLFFPQYVGVSE